LVAEEGHPDSHDVWSLKLLRWYPSCGGVPVSVHEREGLNGEFLLHRLEGGLDAENQVPVGRSVHLIWTGFEGSF
jgi:hypothetical protein